MARDFSINGESLVQVKGAAGTTIANLAELGLAEGPISVTLDLRHKDILLDAWGGEIPADVQVMLGAANIAMGLIHMDLAVLDECLRLSFGGPATMGQVSRAGTRLGANTARLAAGWKYVSLNISSPIAGRPWRFYNAYLTGPPLVYPLGTEKSVAVLNWRAIPYTTDPWQGGVGAANQILFDRTLDS